MNYHQGTFHGCCPNWSLEDAAPFRAEPGVGLPPLDPWQL